MDRNDDQRGSENNDRNVEAARHVEENRRALEEESRRVEATAPDSVDHPIRGLGQSGGSTGANQTGGGGGSSGGGGGMQASEDTSQAEANVRRAEENRDALADEARRVEASAPDDVDHPIRGTGQGGGGSDRR